MLYHGPQWDAVALHMHLLIMDLSVYIMSRGEFSPCFYSNLPDVDVNVGTRLLYDLIVKFALWKLVVLNNQVKKNKNIK